MLTEEQKDIAEKFIAYHKKRGGTLTHDDRYPFKQSIGNVLVDINVIINKKLIKYFIDPN